MATTAVTKIEDAGLIPATQAKTFGELIQKSDLVHRCAQALPKYCTPERWWRAVMTAVNKTPKLAQCTIESVMDCLLEVAQTGLQIGGAFGEAYLIPYKGTCTVQYGYKGLIKLAKESDPKVVLTVGVVHERDVFEYSKGTERFIKHRDDESDNPGALRCAYAIADYGLGQVDFEIMWPRDIKKIRASSRATSGPWFDWEEQMWKKSPLRRLLGRLPKATGALTAMANEDDRMQSAGVYANAARTVGAVGSDLPAITDASDDDAGPDERLIGQIEDLFASKEITGAARTAFVAKVAKARGIAVALVDGRMPAVDRMPSALAQALFEELTK